MTKNEALEIAATAPTPTHELLVELVKRTFTVAKTKAKAKKAKAKKATPTTAPEK
jgi:hypothetical protein